MEEKIVVHTYRGIVEKALIGNKEVSFEVKDYDDNKTDVAD